MLRAILAHIRQNSELLTLTYGALVTQLLKDYKDVAVVNVELEKMYVALSRYSWSLERRYRMTINSTLFFHLSSPQWTQHWDSVD